VVAPKCGACGTPFTRDNDMPPYISFFRSCDCLQCEKCGMEFTRGDAGGVTVAATDELAAQFGDVAACGRCWSTVENTGRWPAKSKQGGP
jgi:hypothetical protein